MEATEDMPREYRTLSLRAVSVDVSVLDRLEVVVEGCVVIPVVVADLRLEITRLVPRVAGGLTIANVAGALDVVREGVSRARHRSPPSWRTACKKSGGSTAGLKTRRYCLMTL